MSKIILILGGVRSGKSSYAVELAKKIGKKVAFIATCQPLDKEMKKRIKSHRNSRPKTWKVFEEDMNISPVLSKLNNKYNVALIDCLGLLISNLIMSNLKDKAIEMNTKKLIQTMLKVNLTTILVSNEVGAGIVPDNVLARRFRDMLGLANQIIAKKADEVIFMQSGIPIIIKGEDNAKAK